MHGETFQRVLQAAAFEVHGREPARERARAFDRVAHEARDPFDLGQDRLVLGRDATGQSAQHERYTRQLLAETIVQIVTYPILLAIDRFENRALELLALAHI